MYKSGEELVDSLWLQAKKNHFKFDELVVEAFLNGQHPSWLHYKSVRLEVDGNELVIEVLSDYLCIGTNEKYVYVPLLASSTPKLCEKSGTILPSTILVDGIWANGETRLEQYPIQQDSKSATPERYFQHTKYLIEDKERSYDQLSLFVGHKKDIVTTARTASGTKNVAIYGWHGKNKPIQPLHEGHSIGYVDYSHGVRLIKRDCLLNREEKDLVDIAKDDHLGKLFFGSPHDPTKSYK